VAVRDIEMPDLDGISALPLLLAKKRNLIIIMASTLTRRNAEISFKALSLGASAYIPTPETAREPAAAALARHDRLHKMAHAADICDHSCRAPRALEPSAGARSRGWRNRQGGPDLSRTGRPPHARRQTRRRYRDRARRRAADQFLQARRRSVVQLRDRCLA